jgi:hypothetical protein
MEYELNVNAVQQLCERLIQENSLKVKSFKVNYWKDEIIGERLCCQSVLRKFLFYKSYRGQILIPKYFREEGSYERIAAYLLKYMEYDIYQYAKDTGIDPEEALIMFFIFHEFGHLLLNASDFNTYGNMKTAREERERRSHLYKINIMLLINQTMFEDISSERYKEEIERIRLAYRQLPSETYADKIGIKLLEQFKSNKEIKQLVENIMAEVE